MFRMSSAEDDILNVLCIQIDREVLEKARQRDRASFFEEEGLAEFLHLQWDTPVEKNLVQEFIESYQVTTCTVKMSTRKIPVDDELMLEVFHLPLGTYKMRKTSKATRIFSPYFRGRRGGDEGFLVRSCNDEVWLDRFVFLQNLFCIRTYGREIPYNFVAFLQAEGRKRSWFDAFKWFFQAEIGRIRRAKGAEICTNIGTHITLLLAHAQKKILRPAVELKQGEATRGQLISHMVDRQFEELKQRRVTKGLLISEVMRRTCHEPHDVTVVKEENRDNESEEKGEGHQAAVEGERIVRPTLNIENVAHHILGQYNMGRQGMRDLVTRMVGLRNEVELWKSECKMRMATLRKKNVELKNEVDTWKSEYGKVQQARDELQEKITLLGTTDNTIKLTGSTVSLDKTCLLESLPHKSARHAKARKSKIQCSLCN